MNIFSDAIFRIVFAFGNDYYVGTYNDIDYDRPIFYNLQHRK